MSHLHLLEGPFVDGENRLIEVDRVYGISSSLTPTVFESIARDVQGPLHWLPLSGRSAGSGIYQVNKPISGTVVGLQINPAPSPRIRLGQVTELTKLALDEIVIDAENFRIFAGASITLEQLNHALRDALGDQYQVLGADLTSYQYAQVGATFMTGGMGPQRRYFSESVVAICLCNGAEMRTVKHPEIGSVAGTYGWTGIVTALECQFMALPENEIAFALPVNNDASSLANLLQALAPLCQFDTNSPGDNVVLGIEHVTVDSMQPYIDSTRNTLTRQASRLRDLCREANADGIVFISARSMHSDDEFLGKLVDDPDASTFTIGGIALDHAEVFPNADDMRAIREGIPYAARTRIPQAKHVFKTHTDAVIALNPL
ncbi:MAG: hypothetical protein AAF420_11480, partial [Pseudomonadota bacterium]